MTQRKGLSDFLTEAARGMQDENLLAAEKINGFSGVVELPTKKEKQTVQTDSPTKQTEQTVQINCPTELPTRTVQPDNPEVQSDRPTELSGHTNQTVQTDRGADTQNEQAKRTVEADMPRSSDPPVMALKKPQLARTANQRALYGYFSANPNIITSYDLISTELDIPFGSVRRTIRLFETAGILHKKKHLGTGGEQGLHIMFEHTKRAQGVNTRSGQSEQTVQNSSMIDRLESNLSIKKRLLDLADEDMDFYYPALARIGFGSDQVRQVVDRLDKIDKSVDKLFLALEYANAELEDGHLKDKDGNPIANPCGYIFNAVARTGYYRKPKEYVTPEELAANDAEERAKATKEAKDKQDAAEYDSWVTSLLETQRKDILAKKTVGPDDAYLRHYWVQNLKGGNGGGV